MFSGLEKSVQCSNSKIKGGGTGEMGKRCSDGAGEMMRAKGPGEGAGLAQMVEVTPEKQLA